MFRTKARWRSSEYSVKYQLFDAIFEKNGNYVKRNGKTHGTVVPFVYPADLFSNKQSDTRSVAEA